MCKLLYFVQMMAYAASITVLTVISVERYFAILHPLRSKQWKTLFLLRVIVFLIWLASAICGIPQLIFYNTVVLSSDEGSTLTFCITVIQHNRKAYVTINFVLWYMLPISLMTLMYSRISVVLWKTSKPDRFGRDPPVWKASNMRVRSSISLTSCLTSNRPKPSISDKGHVRDIDATPEPSRCHQYSGECSREDGRNKDELMVMDEEVLAIDKDLGTNSNVHGKSMCNDIVGDCESSDTVLEIDEWPSKSGHKSSKSEKSGENEEHQRVLDGMELKEIGRPPIAGYLRNGATYDKDSQPEVTPKKDSGQKYVRFTTVQPRWEKNENALLARRRVIRLLIAIIICFALCVMPYHVFMMWQTWRSSNHHRNTYGQMLAAPITFLIFYFNSALNPILYAFLSDNFRRSLRELVQGNRSGVLANRTRRSTLTSKTNNTSV